MMNEPDCHYSGKQEYRLGDQGAFAEAIGEPRDSERTNEPRTLDEGQQQPTDRGADSESFHKERHEISGVQAGAASGGTYHQDERREKDIAVLKTYQIRMKIGLEFLFSTS